MIIPVLLSFLIGSGLAALHRPASWPSRKLPLRLRAAGWDQEASDGAEGALLLSQRLARECRRGRSTLRALQAALPDASPTLRAALERALDAFSAGVPLGYALSAAAEELKAGHPARPLVRLLVTAEQRGLAPEQLAERLDHCARSLEALAQLRADVRASTAATRASQALVALIIPFVLVITLIQSPEIAATLLGTRSGQLILMAVAVLETLAVVLGRQVTRVAEP